MALNDEAVQRLAREGIFEIPVTRTVGLEPEVLQKAGISQETQKVSTGNPVPDAALSSYSLGVHTDSWGGRGSLRVIQRVMVPTGKIVGMAGAGIGVPTENGEWAREAEVLLPSAQTFGVPVSTLVVNDNEEAKRLLREDTTRRSINVGRRSTQTREMSYF